MKAPSALRHTPVRREDCRPNRGLAVFALVIGYSAYRKVAALRNPRNDAKDMAADCSAGLREFRIQGRRAHVALLYDPAKQQQRMHYLTPADA